MIKAFVVGSVLLNSQVVGLLKIEIMKKFLLFLLLLCISYGQVQIGDDINGEELTDFASIVSLSNDGSILAIGAPFNFP